MDIHLNILASSRILWHDIKFSIWKFNLTEMWRKLFSLFLYCWNLTETYTSGIFCRKLDGIQLKLSNIFRIGEIIQETPTSNFYIVSAVVSVLLKRNFSCSDSKGMVWCPLPDTTNMKVYFSLVMIRYISFISMTLKHAIYWTWSNYCHSLIINWSRGFKAWSSCSCFYFKKYFCCTQGHQ